MHVFLLLLFAKRVDVCNLCLPRLWLYTLLQLTGPESRFLLASTPLLQPVLVSLIPDGRVSDKCTLSKGEESSLGFEKMYVGLTRGKVLPPPPPYFFSCNFVNASFKLLGFFPLHECGLSSLCCTLCTCMHICILLIKSKLPFFKSVLNFLRNFC